MEDKYKVRAICTYCGRPYTEQSKAKQCRDSHDIIYIALSKEDLNRLIHFMYTKNEEDIGPTLMKNLEKYQRRVALGKEKD